MCVCFEVSKRLKRVGDDQGEGRGGRCGGSLSVWRLLRT